MLSPRRSALQRGQWSLIGMLVSLAIIVILSAWYYSSILKPHPGSHNGAPASEQAAYGAACGEYQAQMTQAVQMYKQEHNDRNPTSFEQLKKEGVSDEMIHATGCQFQLDAATGTITEIGRGQAAPNAPPVVVNAPSSPAPGPAPIPGGVTLPPNPSSAPPASGGGDGTE